MVEASTIERASSPPPPAGLRGRAWRRFLRGPDQALLDDLYVPALAAAVGYDRCCAYFSSSVLAAAARGFGGLIARLQALGAAAPRPAVRLIVNEELDAGDVRALTEQGDTSRLEALLERRFKSPREALEKRRLEMLAWLVKQGLLEVRVGVMRHGEGIVHAKFGIATDERGDAVVFAGSGNESAAGLRANYEQLEISTSWGDPERYDEYRNEFDRLWTDTHPDVHTVPLPEALRLKLIKLAPRQAPTAEPSTARARQQAAMLWRFVVEAPYLSNGETACDATAFVDLWPHQRRVVADATAAWPDGRLLCDEVGMGKTIEAIMVVRRLLAGRGVRRVLILPPAGLLRQWQAELREKGGLVVPRLDNPTTLVWPDGRTENVADLATALRRDLLLMSRELARLESYRAILLNGPSWDLVLLDEAHHARRREQEEGEFNSGTLLLTLLRDLQLKRKARGFLLLSATPMQTHPWEPWDLLAVLGEGGAWLAEFDVVRSYYQAIASVQRGGCSAPVARRAAELIVGDPAFPTPRDVAVPTGVSGVAQKLGFPLPTEREPLARWLRQGSPLSRRMHRNTRDTLKGYYRLGLVAAPPPRREIDDVLFDYADAAERAVYDAVTAYIEKRFTELEKEKPGKGFVMTIYRRRAVSSPLALERSLDRRREGLERVAAQKAVDPNAGDDETVDERDLGDLSDGEGSGKVSAAYPSDPGVARAELAEVNHLLDAVRALGGRDSKRDCLFDKIRELTDDGRAVLVFTEYSDTLEYLRDTLRPFYGASIGCYSGAGGAVWDGKDWQPVTKDVVTARLGGGDLRVLICTDAASEGLNLQAAGALINYDLPWNPSKIEQRIGRIDRIGQKLPEIKIVNFFLENSIDQRVYQVLRARCGLFVRFVGPMQPVLARARRMLAGQEKVDISSLLEAVDRAGQDELARETYLESNASGVVTDLPALTRADIEEALAVLDGTFGPRARRDATKGTWSLSGTGTHRLELGARLDALERDPSILPLSPLLPEFRSLVDQLTVTGERLPLVVGAAERGSFRRAVACWVTDQSVEPVTTFSDLKRRLASWSGEYADPARWVAAQADARQAAEEEVLSMEQAALNKVQAGLDRQVKAARHRLQLELGRYLACLGVGTHDLNNLLHQQIRRDTASAARLTQCLKRLGGYPSWPPALCQELDEFADRLTENQRKGRLLGKELDAALQDPRWEASPV